MGDFVVGKINGDYKTHDLAVAAYLLMQGKGLLDVFVDKNNGKYVFLFDDKDDTAKALAIKFITSECFLYDSYIRMLRGMVSNP
jgi:hypothetical protein